ncbi:MAG TPA: hypothetical protein VJ997_00515 [Longimicrobiales bacterium]|nr:hypothetical protein [Longimicrobiales bacterium]
MNEVRIVHYRHRYEADMARGFLDEADIPSRLVSDNAAGGVPYIGGLAGAWVVVAGENAQAAVEILESAGMQVGPEEPSGPAVDLARRADTLAPVARAELEDLTRALEKAEKDELKYFVRAALGVTPAAVIPLVGLALGGEVALIALLCVLVVFSEGWKAMKASRRVKQLELALARLDEETREGDADRE